MKASHILLTLLLIVFIVGQAVDSRAAETLRLRLGFQKILDRKGVSRISVGDPEILEAQALPRGDGVLVVGKQEGETNLVLWEKGVRKEWHVEVGARKSAAIEDIRLFAASFPGLTVSEAGGSIIVSGMVASFQEKKILEGFVKEYPSVHLRVTLPEEKKTMLQYDLKIIELSQGESALLGVRWPDATAMKTSASRTNSSKGVISVGTDFETTLNLLLANGKARILTNPKLSCESGEEAAFLAGGEIPIVINTPETRRVEWKTYGIILRINPSIAHGGKVRTKVLAEVSSVDHASGTFDVPGLLIRRVSTHFSSSPGETVMLSGLVKNEMAKDVAKIPLLGHIPVFGELFKSRSFRENQTELAVFITPTEVKENATQELEEWNQKYSEAEKSLRFRLLD
ncbi:MAG: pilus assembly protein N-terminal domain-containing protein [Syntrophorhabdaceae bacterium]|nr:pilus assembly protein N-terminal domain-containing protein [Syntrophorhabdaceae bacterium]